MNELIGSTFSLDLGSLSPVEVKVKEITDNKVIFEYLRSTPGRVEEFTISDFEYFSGTKIKNEVANNKHELDDTLTDLKSFKNSLSEYAAPPNDFGWSLSNLPSYYWETLGECINDIEKYIQKIKS